MSRQEPAPQIDNTALIPGSLGLNREWTIFRAGRRIAGGEPISFYRGRAKCALNADYQATRERLDRDYRRDALSVDDIGPVNGPRMTITEYAKSRGVGPRTARRIMKGLDLLQEEIEVRLVPVVSDPGHTKPDYRATLRLAHWAVQAGFGGRIEARNQVPFDVLSPDGVGWLDTRWPQPVEKIEARRGRPTSSLREEVKSLVEHGKAEAEIARLLGKSRHSVGYHIRVLKKAA